MRKLILALVAASAAFATPASAQYYGGPRVQEIPVVPRDYRPTQRYYEEEPRYERRRYIERDRGFGGPPEYYERRERRRAQAGGTCVTSRGACPTFRPLPLNAPCRCDIPGFGEKRGAVAY